MKVFISSTYVDLKAYRQAAIETVLRNRCEVLAMEYSVAGPQEPVEVCAEDVRDCCIFVGIYAHRYGHIPEGSKKSITQQEYELAKKLGKPCLCFIVEKNFPWIPAFCEWKKYPELETFLAKVKEKNVVAFFSSVEDFKSKFSASLGRQLRELESGKKEDKGDRGPKKTIDEKPFAAYKQYALNEHRHLPLKGFETNLRAPIEIEQVYVTMRAHMQYRDFDLAITGKGKIKERRAGEQLSDLDIKGTFKAAQKHKIKDIVILGDPGSGKTTLLKYILVMLIEGRGEEKLGLDANLIPFFAPLRELRDPDKENFVGFMCRVCCQEKFSISKEDFKNLLQAGRGIVLLDGLDEVADEKSRIKTCQWIDEARKVLVNTPFIITSRFAGYLGDSRLDGGVLEISILDFTPGEVEAFLVRWFETVEVALHPGENNEEIWREKGREQAVELVENIKTSEHIRKLAVNPLMLQIIALIRLDRGTALPERRVELYNECVNVLLEKWELAKGLPVMISARESRKLLQPIALWLHEREGRRSAPLKQIKERIKKPLESLGKSGIDIKKLLLNIRDRGGIFLGYSESEYGFAHLGFQEFLAAEEVRNNHRIELLLDNYGSRWWREVTLLALALDNPCIISPFMELFVRTDAFKTDITLVCDAVNDSLIKPYEPFINVLYDDELTIEAQQNAVRVLARMGGEKAISTLKETVRNENLALANAAFRALESLNAAAGVEPPEKEKAPAIIKIEKDVSEMVLIPEGSFIYGSREDDKEVWIWEKPQQTIYLPSFYMDIYPVTNRQYCRFLNEEKPAKEQLNEWIDLSGEYEDEYVKEKCRIRKRGKDYLVEPGYEEYPIIYVSWFGAKAYSEWADKRLPYEVEWEKAVRGTDGRKYPWGDKFNKKLCNSIDSGIKHTTQVTAYPDGKSPCGCFDMAGNVWEWCADCWDDNNDKSRFKGDLRGPSSGSYRVVRGGSWSYVSRGVRCAYRIRSDPGVRNFDLGFRLCLDI